MSEIIFYTGLMFWLAFLIRLLLWVILHVWYVIPCYCRLLTIPFSPWKKDVSWHKKLWLTLYAPHHWIYADKVAFKNPSGGDHYFVVGKPLTFGDVTCKNCNGEGSIFTGIEELECHDCDGLGHTMWRK